MSFKKYFKMKEWRLFLQNLLILTSFEWFPLHLKEQTERKSEESSALLSLINA